MSVYGITLRVWGNYASFNRPEFKVERVTYDVITPSAARGILEAVHWKPAIRWVVDEIQVLKPIRFGNIRRNEVDDVIAASAINKAMRGEEAELYVDTKVSKNRIQRAALILKDVEYLIKAHFELTKKATELDTPEKHYNIFLRRARQGQCFNQPYFGTREFPACFELVEEGDELPKPIDKTKDLGYMLYDIDFKNNMEPIFFRAQMDHGIVKIEEKLKGRLQV